MQIQKLKYFFCPRKSLKPITNNLLRFWFWLKPYKLQEDLTEGDQFEVERAQPLHQESAKRCRGGEHPSERIDPKIKDLVSLVKGRHNGAALSPHGRLHPFEFSGALGRLLRDHEAHEVPGLVAGAPWDWSLFAFTRSSPGSSHDRSLLL